MDLDFSNIIEAVDQIIIKQSNVDLQLKDFGRYDIADLSNAFLQGFELSRHNYLSDNANANMLCYDLMACVNPYDVTNKQQYFYTLFSKKNIIVEKDILAWIYDGYMNIDKYKKNHIDVMLQICYNDNIVYDNKSDVYKKIEFIHKNGICLQLINDFNNDQYEEKPNEPFYIKANKNVVDLVNLIIASPHMQKIYNYIELVKSEIKASGGDSKSYLSLLSKQRVSLQDFRLELIDEIEKAIDEYIPVNSCVTTIDEAVKEILCDYTSPSIFKNFIRVCVVNVMAVPSLKYLYFVPLPFPNNLQIGHYAYSSLEKMTKVEISQMRIFSNVLMFPFVQSNIVSGYVKKMKFEAVKSAKAAIMSRNMSHNLGSHVMAYLKQNLGSVIDIVKGNVIEKIVSNNQLNAQISLWKDYLLDEAELDVTKGDENKYKNQIELPFLVGIGHFISYMQERQDYIATVSTDYVPYFSSLNFKDDIYDVLNPDLRYLRHTDRIGGRPDNILLSFIARSEGLQRPAYANMLAYEGANIKLEKQAEFESLKSCCIKKRENDIILKFRDFDGLNDVQYIPVTIGFEDDAVDVSKRMHSDGNGNSASCGIGRKDLDDMRSFNLSLPGGIAGRQAIFSIVENIIRNAAKHGAWEERLELVFDVFDCSLEDTRFADSKVGEDVFQLREFLSDNGYFDKEDSRDLYVLTITDNVPIESPKIEQLKTAIEQKYVYDDGSMINENKGIKEIKISASWLRNLTHEEDEIGMAPVLNVRSSNGYLQYIICVPKVKRYAIICSNPELYDKKYMQSIYYYTEASFKAERNKSFEVIAILDDSRLDDSQRKKRYEEIKDRITPISPNHIVRIDDEDLKAIYTKIILGEDVPVDLQKRIDGIYTRMYNINNSPKITIIDKNVAKYAREIFCNNRIECLSGEDGTLPLFMYKTHLETEKNFYSFLNTYILGKEKGHSLFAEGISGGNSTDRLVRGVNRNFTSEWYYKHLSAMCKKVAIFDERLFSKMTNLADNELDTVDRTLIDTIELGAQNTPDKNLAVEEIQELKKIGLVIDENDTYQLVYESVSADINMLLRAKKYAKSHLIAVNFYKNIHIYNIVYNKVTKSFYIYGYTGADKVSDEIKFEIDKVGEISMNGDAINIDFNGDGFDYLSIHQGLLDKIYHQWGILGEGKCSVTQAFYNKIMKKVKTVRFIENYQYMPGFIIHSGRAKPSAIDMPQKQPFIQYASVDHAVSDCKYTLVELLDNARYE